jgi:hypothetical protein
MWLWAQVEGAGPALLTLALATTVCALGWRGVDQAAQAYRVDEFRLHGLLLWDSGWYGGNFPLSYSVLFPPIGALLGIPLTSVLAAVVATWSFDQVVTRYFDSRPLGTWYFAISTLVPVTIGQIPFLTGEAFGLLALVALQRGRKPAAVGLALLAALCSPLAAAFLAMVCLAWAAYSGLRRRWLIATAAVSLGAVLVLGTVFPGTGPFPFPWQGLVVTELLCLTAVTPFVRTTPAVRLGALFYAAASFFSFVVPNPLGGNAPRLAATIGIPLLACFLTAPTPALAHLSPARVIGWVTGGRQIELGPRWRAAAVALVIPFAVWQWAPVHTVVTSAASNPSTQSPFYQPLLAELAAVSPGPLRIEVPPTLEHWEATFLGVAPQISLARGWERQLDIANNPIFYTTGALTAASYESWLNTNGITWVALANAPLDYAGKQEVQLLKSGAVTDLQSVWVTPQWHLWRVVGSPGLVTGPATLTTMAPDHIDLEVSRPGSITVRARYTNFWKVTTGLACLSAAPNGWTTVDAQSAGPVDLSAQVISPSTTISCRS